MIAVRFLPAAEEELLREVRYYTTEARAGTGIRFAAAVEQTVFRIAARPLGGAASAKGTRGMLVKGFPFTVIYRASAEQLLVVPISPHRRRPLYWASRVEEPAPGMTERPR